MSQDPEIQFGDLEHEQPDVALRPDRNAHFAVAPYGEPQEGELPIFIDLDVLIEMESHALEDTSVELGGVMLGGQLHDADGKPYILVQDNLRAEHYEATKGSFKFTHDTWQEITRRRDEFPENWDMVGWYHTHPDWGVFLSGMDMFICDHFFNKPLDVALVIDPCRQDRAFFQWTGDPRDRKRRVGGFHVIASRHRQAELEQFVAELEGGYSMRTDPRVRQGYQVSSGGSAPTIVNITEQRPGWLGQAVVATMITQGLLILLLFMYVMRGPQAADQAAQRDGALSNAHDLKLKTDVVDDLLKNVSGERDVASRLQEKETKIAKLENDLAAYTTAVPQLSKDRETFLKERDDLKSQMAELQDKFDAADQSALEWKKKYESVTETTAAGDDDGSQPRQWWAPLVTWQGITVSVVVLAALALATTMVMRGSGSEETLDENHDHFDDQPPPEGQFAPPENQPVEPSGDEPPKVNV
jgi:proteasome lid subunit RPN8/RPN11